MDILEVLRQEKKYLLNICQTERIRYLLDAALERDVHNEGLTGYIVRSLYFDTPDDTDYREKEDGIESRRKIRLRIYGTQTSSAKLEFKEKQGDFQRKRSLTLSRAEAEELVEGRYGCLTKRREEFAAEMYGRMEEKLYRPKCIVEYDRSAWFVPANDIRITLDSSVRATEGNYDLFAENLHLYPVSEIGSTTLEVKFNRFLLSYVRDLLGLHGEPQVSASKYCMARNIGMRSCG